MSEGADIAPDQPLIERILAALAYVRPYLQRDGGDVEFVRFEEETRTCEIRMVGSCQHCALAPLTLRAGVEKALIYRVPEIRRVERVR
jgi:Fe-S cluster biogenesis protein NfuA